LEMSIEIKRHPIFEGIDLGVGTAAWGDRLLWGYRQGYQDEDLKQATEVSLAGGINFFDTAEVYGSGRAESLLGQFLKPVEQPVKITTKFMPYPWRLGRGSLLSALRASLSRLGRTKVALYLVHQPLPPVRVETWMDAMTEAFQAGMIEAIGVSNYDRSRTQRAYDALTRSGLTLAANQVEYSLLNRGIEKNGLLGFCRELGITVIAYSPLAKGVLTGKYSPQNPLRGVRSTMYTPGFLAKAQNLINQLKKIGSDHGGKSAGQVALNWTMCKGTIPIPGAKNLQQAEQNLAAKGWSLTDDEISLLDEMSDRVYK
jgi:aryl-alcohol dehydrogenase-like predicted oxidoreductase